MSGASSVPGLSAAAIDAHRAGFARIEGIAIDLSPGNRAPRGPAVIAALLGYCGRPIARWEKGAWRTVYGGHDLRRGEIDGIGRRWLSACDVPDLALFPPRYPGVATVTFHTGLELAPLHLGLWLLAWLPRLGFGRSLSGLTRPALLVGALTRGFGSDRGGMSVTLAGVALEGTALRRRWSLIADAGDGPFVRAPPAVLLAAKLARGPLTVRGARPCLDLFTLDEFCAEVADLEVAAMSEPLFRRMLGAEFERLPEALRTLHDRRRDTRAVGRCAVALGRTPLARMLARLLRLPPAAADIPLAVDFVLEQGGETWCRDFAGAGW